MSSQFWQKKRVLVTGHTGFKGTWLCKLLNGLGAEVYGFAKKADTDFYEKANPYLKKECISDLKERETLEDFIQACHPEMVLHLASYSTVDASNEKHEEIFQTNSMGLIHLLEALRMEEALKAILIVTSDKCYQNKENGIPYQEEDSLGAQDAYSTSKACQELISECYKKTVFQKKERPVALATARASNVLGAFDYHKERLVPSLVEGLLEEGEASIRSGDAIRPWQNVLDALGGYLCLMKKMYEHEADSKFSIPYNFGPEIEDMITVRQLASLVQKACGEGVVLETQKTISVKETKTLMLSNEKAKRNLGWRPVYRIEDTVNHLVWAAKQEKEGKSCERICKEMVADYLKRCQENGIEIL